LLNKRLPFPQPDPDAANRLVRRARLSRNAVAACGVAALAGFSVIAFSSTRSQIADFHALAIILENEQPAPASAYAIPAEELRANWPRFRGYEGAGVAAEGPAVKAAPDIVWQKPSPASGFNSPIIWKQRMFFTGGDAGLREVFCLNTVTGELEWRQRVNIPAPASAGEVPEIPEMTGYAASTAATDGERVYAIFATGELAAFTLEGQLVWSKNVGPLDNPYGHAASLATWENQLIVQLDQGYEDSRKSKIQCWDGGTGEMLWQKSRPVGASWTSPIVVEASGKPQVLTLSLPWAISYSPTDGTELWRAGPIDGEVTPSPVYAGGRFFVVNPGTYQLMAIRSDGSGDISKTHIEWIVDGDMPDITSPVSNGERVFTVTSGGDLTCFDGASGTEVWKHSLEAKGEFQASPSITGSTLLLLSAAGDVIGVEAESEFRELWRMSLEDEFHATPAFANGHIYLRGNKNVWCLGSDAAMTSREE
jgi:outer membrane protein assembly factor BamB